MIKTLNCVACYGCGWVYHKELGGTKSVRCPVCNGRGDVYVDEQKYKDLWAAEEQEKHLA